MGEDLVMRSVYMRPSDDGKLRQLAHELNVSKSELIRAAISLKLDEWLDGDDDRLVLEDLRSAGSGDAGDDEAVPALVARKQPPAAAAAPAAAKPRAAPAPRATAHPHGKGDRKRPPAAASEARAGRVRTPEPA